jgi:hypothetical protein
MAIVVFDKIKVDTLLKSRRGEVGRFLIGKATEIATGAKAQVGVRTGALKKSIGINHERTAAGQKVLVGSNLSYAYMHHQGTRPRVIVARPGKVLRFSSRGGVVYTESVRHPGTRANRYLTDNLRRVMGRGTVILSA